MKDALKRSGYLLEARVGTILDMAGFFVDLNSAYVDSQTKKTRELDILARKIYPLDANWEETVSSVLTVECINNSQPLTFIMQQDHISSVVGVLHVQHSGLESVQKILPKAERSDPENFLLKLRNHHYLTKLVASQYCTFLQKKNQGNVWMAHHEEIHFDAFEKLCDSTVFYIDRRKKQDSQSGDPIIHLELFYPLLIVQGELIECLPSKRSLRLRTTRRVLFTKERCGTDLTRIFYIDVLRESELPSYLTIIEKEMKGIVNYLKKRLKRDKKRA